MELNSARTRVNVTEAYATLALSARRNTQLLAQALSVITEYDSTWEAQWMFELLSHNGHNFDILTFRPSRFSDIA